MHPDFGLILFLGFGVIGFVWFIQGHRLFYIFRSKYPEIARKEIPYAFSQGRHPEKFFYFFRRKSYDLLKSDPSIWKVRQQVKYLTITLFIIVPFLFFSLCLGLAILGLFSKA